MELNELDILSEVAKEDDIRSLVLCNRLDVKTLEGVSIVELHKAIEELEEDGLVTTRICKPSPALVRRHVTITTKGLEKLAKAENVS